MRGIMHADRHSLTYQGFVQEICSGGGNFVSGEQWAWEACLSRGGGGLGVPPRNLFVGALRLILVGFGNSCDSTCTCKLPVKSGTGDCGHRYR